MRLKSLLLLLPVIFSALVAGCSHTIERQMIRDELSGRYDDVVMSARLRDGSQIIFDDRGARFDWMDLSGTRGLAIVGRTVHGEQRVTAVSDIAEALVRSDETDVAATGLATTGVAAGAIVVLYVGILLALLGGWH